MQRLCAIFNPALIFIGDKCYPDGKTRLYLGSAAGNLLSGNKRKKRNLCCMRQIHFEGDVIKKTVIFF
jgi:hypothetical protein